MKRKIYIAISLVLIAFVIQNCTKSNASNNNGPANPPPAVSNAVMDAWVTAGDQSSLLQKQSGISFTNTSNNYNFIDVDSSQSYQTIDGFGYTLTGGSAYVINKLSPSDRTNLLQELFGNSTSSIGISYLRISIGASDLNASVFTYDDMPSGQTDTSLQQFSLANDQTDLIPLLKDILAINPAIKILATPWSAPVWMKDNSSSIGGHLQKQYYNVYAQYFVKYIQQMKAAGISIDAVTLQNEPLNPSNNPSMLMSAAEQTDFIKNFVGPAFQAANISAKIILYDHNCDQPNYPLTVLADAAAYPFINGSAFHLYAGDISALTAVHNAFPNKQLYFTEQYTASTGDFSGDLKWHMKNVVIGAMRNWSRNALEWNLANDVYYSPHTNGGCNTCKGALTIGSSIIRNVSYYIIAHASKFVPAGSTRIASNITGSINNVAFITPAGKKVLIVENDGNTAASFNIRYNNNWATVTLQAGAVGTYVW
ncbi:MAG: glucosylceramidase [Bacteroidota bacterium]|nr:glucosylceramidase [Bacteroidota bacterium]